MLKVIASMLIAALAVAGPNDLNIPRPEALTVHEWGTFTTVAGADGHPIDWLPLGGPTDLPCFIDRFGDRFLKYVGPLGPVLSYQEARSRLTGKVRMETPVLYFYAPGKTTLNVRIDFPRGLITEWYPTAKVSQPSVHEKALIANAAGSRIEWNNVQVLPGSKPNLPFEGKPSHYYAARETDADPVQVNGKDEKFLFYRGVGNFPIPVSAQAAADGRILIGSVGADAIPALILFENRGGRIGYRVHGKLDGKIALEPPPLNADFESLRRELEKTLIAEGLYAREAQAMVETWRDSWFEEGTRVFYIVPSRIVDAILPLKVEPRPAHVARAFVGRVEVITAATVKAVEEAIAANDIATLAKHGRFLGPLTDRIAATPQRRELADAAYKSFLGGVSSACR